MNTDRIVPYYILKDEHDNILTGKFYHNQLVKTSIETYRGHVLKTRKTRGKTEHLMRFIGYDESYDLWIPAKDIEKIRK